MMNISLEAEEKIKKAIETSGEKSPRIVLKKGGGAGNMLVLTLEKPEESDEFVEINGIKFAVSGNALKFVDDISIEVKMGLGEEIIIRNNNAKTCRCGKSFRA